MTQQEMEIKHAANARVLGPKIIQAIKDKMTSKWLSTQMTTEIDGYTIIKRLMRYYIPALNPSSTSSAYLSNLKPE